MLFQTSKKFDNLIGWMVEVLHSQCWSRNQFYSSITLMLATQKLHQCYGVNQASFNLIYSFTHLDIQTLSPATDQDLNKYVQCTELWLHHSHKIHSHPTSGKKRNCDKQRHCS